MVLTTRARVFVAIGATALLLAAVTLLLTRDEPRASVDCGGYTPTVGFITPRAFAFAAIKTPAGLEYQSTW